MKFSNKIPNLFFVLIACASFPLMASETSSSAPSATPEHRVFEISQFGTPSQEIFSDDNGISDIHEIFKEKNFPLTEKGFEKGFLSESSLEKGITRDLMRNEEFTLYPLPRDSFGEGLFDSNPFTLPLLTPKKDLIVRGGIKLPSIDSGVLGLDKFFANYGVDIGFDVRFSFHTSLPANLINNFSDNQLCLLDRFSFLRFDEDLDQDIEDLLSKEIDQLSEEEVIVLFKILTYERLKVKNSDSKDLNRTLEKLLADERSRNIILQKSSQNSEEESDDYILKAIQDRSFFLDEDLIKILFSYPEFVCHLRKSQGVGDVFEYLSSSSWLLNDPVLFSVFKGLVEDEASRSRLLRASSEGEKDLILKAMKTFALMRKNRALAVLFSQEELFRYLSEKKDKDGNDEIMTSLLCAIQLNSDGVVSTFFKIPNVFRHLLSHKGDDIVLNAYVNSGLLMSLSSRSSGDIEDLLHDDLVRFLGGNSPLLRQIISKALEEKNALLAVSFLKTRDLTFLPEEVLSAIRIPAVWSLLDPSQKSFFCEEAKAIKPDFTVESLEEKHQYITAVEHARTSHSHLAEDMKKFSPGLTEKYQAILSDMMDLDSVSAEGRKLELLSHKYKLESRFFDELRGVSKEHFSMTPWGQALTNFAYDQKFFGQGVKSLVVELGELPLNQKEGFLKTHLGAETLFKEGAQGGRSNHNIGVTSLVTKIAPLSKVDSTISRELEAFEGDILSGEYPFINCSWGPTDDLRKEEKISIFSSHQFLNDLLGNDKVVLIKSAGNESVCLSNPCLKDDPSGICFARLLGRLEEESFSNLILAINITPCNTVAESSNTPGGKDNLKHHSLCAQGCETFWLDETGHDYRPLADGGTSSAAPIITGAATLLQSYKPHFTPVHIKNCLMHSASRDFYTFDEVGTPVSYVYEKERHEDSSLPQSKYSFDEYGMGLLNVKRAFHYSDILDEHLQTRASQVTHNSISFDEYEKLRNRM